MTRAKCFFACLILASCCSMAVAQSAKPDEQHSLTQIVDRALSGVEGEFVPAADAMPEDKYSYAPTNGEFKGVRTFEQQVKHVAAVNYMVGAAILGEKPPLELGSENGPNSVKTKADIMKFLKDSFAYMHKADATINAANATGLVQSPFGQGKSSRLGLATLIVGHCFDHYGQMVEYLRANGVVPPASR